MKKLIFIFLCFLSISCEIENVNYLAPIMVTDKPQNVLANSAILGGKALGEGGKDITEFGIVWSVNNPPTINDNKIIEGERLGSFSKLYDVFESGTTYYYSVYGISEAGAGYGQVYEFTTNPDPPCDPDVDNSINLGVFTDSFPIPITDVTLDPNGYSVFDANIKFTSDSYPYSRVEIILGFNEKDKILPGTGEYIAVRSFDSNDEKSQGNVLILVADRNIFDPSSFLAESGTKIYVENLNNRVTFIFCDTLIGDKYLLNGKFTYTE
ncbi:hypothetical protein [uncultured Aquimarina sp.]|uniref:hypothetical protein n=1 Tax=uncultured Aquimarina sp. TaxID=575652 RepID=UPI0026083B0F|nr:hypothetical protein [uncultured Aquimarina sp.]